MPMRKTGCHVHRRQKRDRIAHKPTIDETVFDPGPSISQIVSPVIRSYAAVCSAPESNNAGRLRIEQSRRRRIMNEHVLLRFGLNISGTTFAGVFIVLRRRSVGPILQALKKHDHHRAPDWNRNHETLRRFPHASSKLSDQRSRSWRLPGHRGQERPHTRAFRQLTGVAEAGRIISMHFLNGRHSHLTIP